MRTILTLALIALVALFVAPTSAIGHAVLIESSPAADALLAQSPEQVELGFNEPIQIVDPAVDADVVASDGTPVQSGPAFVPPDASDSLVIPLRADLAPDTYTVRYRIIGADSHVIPGALVFGVGIDELSEPYLIDAASTGGPSETSPVGVSARFLELATIGGLLGLLSFRWLVWRPSLRRLSEPDTGRRRVEAWGHDGYWVAFGVLALLSMLSVGWSLVVQTATVFGTSVTEALGDTAAVSIVLGDTRVGELIQLRAALLFVAFALAAWQFLAEQPGQDGGQQAAALRASGMAALLVVALGVVGYQGHASVAPGSVLQVPSHVIHTAAVGIWLGGLAGTIWVLARAPKVAGPPGQSFASLAVSRYARVAVVVLAVVVVTGVIRLFGQLEDPSQLWTTAYGRVVLFKLIVLTPVIFLGLWSGRVVSALRRLRTRPSRAALALLPPRAAVELGLGIVIVVAAALLAGEVPGRL